MVWWVLLWILVAIVVGLVALAIYDRTQRTHAILRNFPVIGHLRFILEAVGPELRQYIVTDNDEERPFSRDQRRWVYSSAKAENTYFGFGTDNDLEQTRNYTIVKQVTFPVAGPPDEPMHPDPSRPLPCAKVLGGAAGRAKAFRPSSVVNVSAMSFGSLSGNAIEALNKGCALAGALHTTGEGGISPHHRNGGDLVWQIGTGYFGCRNEDGTFDLDRLVATVETAPVRAIEIKLSQGAKPGLGGMLPGAKVTPEIAAIRGIPVGVDCKSPAGHTAFHDVDGMLELIERIAEATGLPVGIKSAVGEHAFWDDLSLRMAATGTGPDFVTIDGGEGGTGAAPLSFSDHVSLPFRWGFTRVYRTFAERGVADRTVFVGSGQPRAARDRAGGHGPRLRPGQRRSHRHVLHRVHPGPALPHRPLPDGRRHPEPPPHPRSRPRPQVRPLRQLPGVAALRAAAPLAGLRRGPPGARDRRPARGARGPLAGGHPSRGRRVRRRAGVVRRPRTRRSSCA